MEKAALLVLLSTLFTRQTSGEEFCDIIVSGRVGYSSHVNGIYIHEGEFDERPYYMSERNDSETFYIYFYKEFDYWLVGEELGSTNVSGYADDPDAVSVELIDADWVFWDLETWETDENLEINCLDDYIAEEELETPEYDLYFAEEELETTEGEELCNIIISGREGFNFEINGIYIHEGELNGRPYYVYERNDNVVQYIYFYGDFGYWLVGEELGSTNVFAYADDSDALSAGLIDVDWVVWDSEAWVSDRHLEITCFDEHIAGEELETIEDECNSHSECTSDTYCNIFSDCWGPCSDCEIFGDAIDEICPLCSGQYEEEIQLSGEEFCNIIVVGRMGFNEDMNGIYIHEGEFNGRPYYISERNDNEVFCIYFNEDYNLWLMSEELGSTVTFAYVDDFDAVSVDLIEVSWVIWDAESWIQDDNLEIICFGANYTTAEEEEPEIIGEHGVYEEINGEEINGEEINGEEINGEEINGEEINGEEINGDEIYGEELYGKEEHDLNEEIYGEEIYGEEIYGEEIYGEEIYGEEMHGEEMHGEEIHGEEIYGEEAREVREEIFVEEEDGVYEELYVFDGECSSHSDCSGDTYCDSLHQCWAPCISCEYYDDAIDGVCPPCPQQNGEEIESSLSDECYSHSHCDGDTYCDIYNFCFGPCSSCYSWEDPIDGSCPQCTGAEEEEQEISVSLDPECHRIDVTYPNNNAITGTYTYIGTINNQEIFFHDDNDMYAFIGYPSSDIMRQWYLLSFTIDEEEGETTVDILMTSVDLATWPQEIAHWVDHEEEESLLDVDIFCYVAPPVECTTHSDCSNTAYCDSFNGCFYCQQCDVFNDAIDGQCPHCTPDLTIIPPCNDIDVFGNFGIHSRINGVYNYLGPVWHRGSEFIEFQSEDEASLRLIGFLPENPVSHERHWMFVEMSEVITPLAIADGIYLWPNDIGNWFVVLDLEADDFYFVNDVQIACAHYECTAHSDCYDGGYCNMSNRCSSCINCDDYGNEDTTPLQEDLCYYACEKSYSHEETLLTEDFEYSDNSVQQESSLFGDIPLSERTMIFIIAFGGFGLVLIILSILLCLCKRKTRRWHEKIAVVPVSALQLGDVDAEGETSAVVTGWH